MNQRNQKGITIIVLTITIIILLILAGVSISLIIKSNVIDDSEDLRNKTVEYMNTEQTMRNEVRDLYDE